MANNKMPADGAGEAVVALEEAVQSISLTPDDTDEMEVTDSGRKLLTGLPCGEFNEGDVFDGACCVCGHPQESHEFPEVGVNRCIQVASDGMMSRLIMRSDITDSLRPGVYILRMTREGFVLRHSQSFDLPKRIYGDCDSFSQRVIKTFSLIGRGMGVLLSGGKGTGKTVTARLLMNKAMASGLPVIIIDQPFGGAGLLSFLDDLPGRCVFFIDEWEKIYDTKESRNFFLGVLDGTCVSRHLFVMTTNTEDVGEFFISRPGRIRYHKKYSGLPEGYIRGIVTDKIKDERLREKVIEVARGIFDITPDVLTAMIEEAVMHNESPEEFLDFFNVSTKEPPYDILATVRHLIVRIPPDVVKDRDSREYYDLVKEARELQSFIDYSCGSEDFGGEEWRCALVNDYPRTHGFIEESIVVAERAVCYPFFRPPGGQIAIRVNNLSVKECPGMAADARRRMNLNVFINHDKVANIIRNGTKITVVAKNGDKVIAIPSREVMASGGAGLFDQWSAQQRQAGLTNGDKTQP